MDVPVQFFQSIIGIELAVAGALLWEMRFFESPGATRDPSEHLPDSRLRVGLALIMGDAVRLLMGHRRRGPEGAALAVTVGLAVSILPILLRLLPPFLGQGRGAHRR